MDQTTPRAVPTDPAAEIARAGLLGTPRQGLIMGTWGFFIGFAAVSLYGPAAHAFQQVENHLALPARGQPAPSQRFVNRRNPPHFKQPRLRVVARIGQHFELRLNHLQIA